MFFALMSHPRSSILSTMDSLFSMAAYMSGVFPVTASETFASGLLSPPSKASRSRALRLCSQAGQSPFWDWIRTRLAVAEGGGSGGGAGVFLAAWKSCGGRIVTEIDEQRQKANYGRKR